jgi:hypothetical protein
VISELSQAAFISRRIEYFPPLTIWQSGPTAFKRQRLYWCFLLILLQICHHFDLAL